MAWPRFSAPLLQKLCRANGINDDGTKQYTVSRPLFKVYFAGQMSVRRREASVAPDLRVQGGSGDVSSDRQVGTTTLYH